jgi:hypothetical protein
MSNYTKTLLGLNKNSSSQRKLKPIQNSTVLPSSNTVKIPQTVKHHPDQVKGAAGGQVFNAGCWFDSSYPY